MSYKYTAEQLLEGRHEYRLSWSEPWQACGPEGNDLDAHVEHRVTVHDAINMSRLVARAHGRPTVGQDEEHLLDFITVHWAAVIPPEEELTNNNMQPHQQRVVGEKTELDERIGKLEGFLQGSIYPTLPLDEASRLTSQHHHMTEYSRILGERIANFPADV